MVDLHIWGLKPGVGLQGCRVVNVRVSGAAGGGRGARGGPAHLGPEAGRGVAGFLERRFPARQVEGVERVVDVHIWGLKSGVLWQGYEREGFRRSRWRAWSGCRTCTSGA